MENSRRRRGGYCMRIASRRAAVCDSGPSGTAGAGAGASAGAGALASPGRPRTCQGLAFQAGQKRGMSAPAELAGQAGTREIRNGTSPKPPATPLSPREAPGFQKGFL